MHSLRYPEQVYNPWHSHASDGDVPVHRDELVSNYPGLNPDMILPPPPTSQPDQPIRLHPRMPQTDPRIASIKAIFPDFDDSLILSVLEEAGGDHDRAADVLLGMSDPTFIPPEPTPQPLRADPFDSVSSYNERLSQEALDEEFARRLALEEEEHASRAWTRWQDAPSYLMYQPYQGRRSGRSGRSQSQSQSQQEAGRDTMTEFQEGFNRIAESGKKTFASIMSKVRAKMQDLDHGQGWSGSQTRPDQIPTSSYAPPHEDPAQARSTLYPPRSGVLHPVATEQTQPSYYDPNAHGYDLYADDEVTLNTPSPLATAPPASALSPAGPPSHRDVDGVEVVEREGGSPVPPLAPETRVGLEARFSPSPPPVPVSMMSPPGVGPAPSLSQVVGPKGTGAGRGAQVDFSKLGLLPKRPISLVRPQSPPTGAGVSTEASIGAPRIAIAHSDSTTASSDREPEFVENPFEDV